MKIFSTGDQPDTADEMAKVKLGETSLDQNPTIRDGYSRSEGTLDHICTVSFDRERQAEPRDAVQLGLADRNKTDTQPKTNEGGLMLQGIYLWNMN